MDETSDFLDQIRHGTGAIGDRGRALDIARGVFFALLHSHADACRDVAELLPDELETVWKPALFTCLRREDDPTPEGEADDFVSHVQEQVPDLEEPEARAAVASVLRALTEHLEPPEQAELAELLPDELRDALTLA